MQLPTDLALEQKEMLEEDRRTPEGVESDEIQMGQVRVTRIRVRNEAGERALGRKQGTYVTVEVPPFTDDAGLDENALAAVRRELAALLRTVACVHDREGMARELEIMVDQGCQVVDVVVEHPIYGQLAGQLHLSSRYDVQEFIRSVSKNQANLLSDLTGGIHLHTLRCPSEEAFQRVRAALDEAGLLWKG